MAPEMSSLWRTGTAAIGSLLPRGQTNGDGSVFVASAISGRASGTEGLAA